MDLIENGIWVQGLTLDSFFEASNTDVDGKPSEPNVKVFIWKWMYVKDMFKLEYISTHE